jgi:hypothetical protein
MTPGETLGNRYQLHDILGQGGTGLVYKARDLILNEDIAIKVLRPEASTDPGVLERFKREITTSRKITHPSVIRIHDMGVHDNEIFISMELLNGGTLSDWIQAQEPGPPALVDALDAAISVCEGIHAVHQEDIIHRDVKPHNVLFDDKGRAKIADFGIARIISSAPTSTGAMGTPFYMSPEQVRGSKITRASDIYSLGVLLYELFTGDVPFKGRSWMDIAAAHTDEHPPLPRTIRPDLPADIERLITKAMAKDPNDRFQSAEAMAQGLRRARRGHPVLRIAQAVQSVPWLRDSVVARLQPMVLVGIASALLFFAVGLVSYGAIRSASKTPEAVAGQTPPEGPAAQAGNAQQAVATKPAPQRSGPEPASRAQARPRTASSKTATATRKAATTRAPPARSATKVAARPRTEKEPPQRRTVEAAPKVGYLKVLVQGGWAYIQVDNNARKSSTQLREPFSLPAGVHKVKLVKRVKGGRTVSYSQTVRISGGNLTQITFSLDPKTWQLEGKPTVTTKRVARR